MPTSDRPAYMDKVTLLRRSRTGDYYHRATCPNLGTTSLPWLWAEGKTRQEVESQATELHPCKRCDPLAALPEDVAP